MPGAIALSPNSFRICCERAELLKQADQAFVAADRERCIELIWKLYEFFDRHSYQADPIRISKG